MQQIQITNMSPEELKELVKECIKESISKQEEPKTGKEKNEEQFLSVKEVQELLKISKVTIHSWKKKGKIKPHSIGRKIFFKKSQIISLLEGK
jgi:excisionase family DNA binding protein